MKRVEHFTIELVEDLCSRIRKTVAKNAESSDVRQNDTIYC